uniref:Uncharacterized protein n=1 Tax=Glossina pallidipes TaxID=7398 RepID=A0A1A9ZA23_GLOPL
MQPELKPVWGGVTIITLKVLINQSCNDCSNEIKKDFKGKLFPDIYLNFYVEELSFAPALKPHTAECSIKICIQNIQFAIQPWSTWVDENSRRLSTPFYLSEMSDVDEPPHIVRMRACRCKNSLWLSENGSPFPQDNIPV